MPHEPYQITSSPSRAAMAATRGIRTERRYLIVVPHSATNRYVGRDRLRSRFRPQWADLVHQRRRGRFYSPKSALMFTIQGPVVDSERRYRSASNRPMDGCFPPI
jgi:hypothetical protein